MSWEEVFRNYLDDKDIRILKLLNQDANISDAKLGKLVGTIKDRCEIKKSKAAKFWYFENSWRGSFTKLRYSVCRPLGKVEE